MVGALFFIMVEIPVSAGELLDKLSILQIKKNKITNPEKLEKVSHESNLLMALSLSYLEKESIDKLFNDLMGVNLQLWDVEDKIRILEKEQRFEGEFISLARAVYHLNDERFNIKNRINILLGSDIQEVKQYIEYK